MRLNPVSQFLICGNDFFREIAVRVKKFHAARKPRCDDIRVLEKYFRFRLALKTRDPWLNGPDRVHPTTLKERELIRIRCGHHRNVAPSLSDLKSLRFQPRPAGSILR